MIETTISLPCPISLALLTDFHNTDPVPILKSLNARKPEIICVSGDFIYGDDPEPNGRNITENSNVFTFLRGCAETAPTFVSFGNHEWMLSPSDLEVITRTGITLLDNSLTRYKNTVIGGLSSAYYTGYRALRREHPELGLYPFHIKDPRYKKTEPELDWLGEFCRQQGYRILLCHHPEYYPKYLQTTDIDLILSGHAHGGQWRYYSLLKKEWRGLIAPGQGFFPELTSGVKDGRLVISRGLSNTTHIPRINNPTEIIYIQPR